MKTENAKRAVLVLFVAIFLAIIVHHAYALSIGVSPSEKTVTLVENEGDVVYFAISQGSEETETVEVSVDVNWLTPEMASFELASMEQKYLKFTIDPLQLGDYNAKIKVSTGVSDSMKTSVFANLRVSVITFEEQQQQQQQQENATQYANVTETEAIDSINNAQEAIDQAKDAGIDVSNAESMLTNALEEFASGNYDDAKRFADTAYSAASSEHEQSSQAKSVLDPLKFALVIIAVGAGVVLAVLAYEVMKSRGSKGVLSRDHSKKCPRCGSKTFMSYNGTFISSYRCTKCGYNEVHDKHHTF
ncbi:MAG TPA: hypothetical protein VJ343_01680 [archaeon]|nr:hypothetical protein [archaeon]